jgi:twitching motility two-component system response regulator PilG
MNSFSSSPADGGGPRQSSVTRPLNDVEGSGKLVMVIDDSKVICRIVQYALADYAIATIPFSSGVDAINALTSRAVPIPDLVLVDIRMPDMNGYDVTRVLHSNKAFNGVPIVMLSGRDGIFNRIWANFAGADEFISKPFDRPAFVRKIFELLRLDPPDPDAGSRN